VVWTIERPKELSREIEVDGKKIALVLPYDVPGVERRLRWLAPLIKRAGIERVVVAVGAQSIVLEPRTLVLCRGINSIVAQSSRRSGRLVILRDFPWSFTGEMQCSASLDRVVEGRSMALLCVDPESRAVAMVWPETYSAALALRSIAEALLGDGGGLGYSSGYARILHEVLMRLSTVLISMPRIDTARCRGRLVTAEGRVEYEVRVDRELESAEIERSATGRSVVVKPVGWRLRGTLRLIYLATEDGVRFHRAEFDGHLVSPSVLGTVCFGTFPAPEPLNLSEELCQQLERAVEIALRPLLNISIPCGYRHSDAAQLKEELSRCPRLDWSRRA